MSTDKLIFKPTNRNSITEIEPNNNAVAILDDRVFDITSGNNAVLNAIESIDTGLITGNVNIDLVLSALEAVDSSNVTSDNLITAYLEESENLDTVLLSAKAILTASLSETDNIDTALITSTVIAAATIETIDTKDIAEIIAFSGVDRNAELNVTENSDSSIIRVSHKTVERSRTYIPYSRVANLKFEYPVNLKLNLTENKDGVKITAESDYDLTATIKESGDGIRIKSHVEIITTAIVSEKQDGFSPVDVDEFIEIVNYRNEQYEKSEFELFRMVA